MNGNADTYFEAGMHALSSGARQRAVVEQMNEFQGIASAKRGATPYIFLVDRDDQDNIVHHVVQCAQIAANGSLLAGGAIRMPQIVDSSGFGVAGPCQTKTEDILYMRDAEVLDLMEVSVAKMLAPGAQQSQIVCAKRVRSILEETFEFDHTKTKTDARIINQLKGRVVLVHTRGGKQKIMRFVSYSPQYDALRLEGKNGKRRSYKLNPTTPSKDDIVRVELFRAAPVEEGELLDLDDDRTTPMKHRDKLAHLARAAKANPHGVVQVQTNYGSKQYVQMGRNVIREDTRAMDGDASLLSIQDQQFCVYFSLLKTRNITPIQFTRSIDAHHLNPKDVCVSTVNDKEEVRLITNRELKAPGVLLTYRVLKIGGRVGAERQCFAQDMTDVYRPEQAPMPSEDEDDEVTAV